MIKVTFDETARAKKGQEFGIRLFSMKIPAYDIKQNEFISLMTPSVLQDK